MTNSEWPCVCSKCSFRSTFAVLSLVTGMLFFTGCASDEEYEGPATLPVIPAPASVTWQSGLYRLDASSGFRVNDPSLIPVAQRQAEAWRRPTGYPWPVSPQDGDLQLSIVADLGPESYRISVSGSGVEIESGGPAGAFYALQTIHQMLPPEISGSGPGLSADWVLPQLTIADAPRFGYRGMHLDVGRHFFDVDFVKRYIDTMARYKFNVFHWHLTEDQGWRIEIDAYPRLTEVGAWRSETVVDKNLDPYIGDGIPHGGFYTKDQIREVVQYASDRFVTIVPEVDMPGHMGAALAAYPELGCHEGPYEVKTTWGIQEDILCPSEETFAFVENVLSEVAELFPGPYIHIGGDEVPKKQWQQSPLAQALIRKEVLADEIELQSWFNRRVEVHLSGLGKRLVGWDEILEGGLAPNATVMSWRGTTGGIEAARMGHDVIMTPTNYMYFDFYQGDPETEPLAMNWAQRIIPLDTVYVYEPVPAELNAEESRHILGAQANIWTEYISTPEYVEYMAWPRAMALAEVVWSPRELRNLDDFYARLAQNLPHLERLGVNYRIPERLTGTQHASTMQ